VPKDQFAAVQADHRTGDAGVTTRASVTFRCAFLVLSGQEIFGRGEHDREEQVEVRETVRMSHRPTSLLFTNASHDRGA
jgi:hypothetical protein